MKSLFYLTIYPFFFLPQGKELEEKKVFPLSQKKCNQFFFKKKYQICIVKVFSSAFNLTTKKSYFRTSTPLRWSKGNNLSRPTILQQVGTCPSAYFPKRCHECNDHQKTIHQHNTIDLSRVF